MCENSTNNVYVLEERTALFGELAKEFPRTMPLGTLTNRLRSQIIGAATSVGANYCEANDTVSIKDFKHRISICKKEARVAKFFIRMIIRALLELRDSAKPFWQEAKELHLIFAKIYRP